MAVHSSADEGSIRVRALFDFDYTPVQNESTAISFKAGDEWWLVSKTSDNWWLVRHLHTSKSFYVPATYVEIVEKPIPSPRSPSTAPKPKTRAISAVCSLEDSVLKELDSILDLEENESPSDTTFPNPDYEANSDSEGDACYANMATLRNANRSSNKHADSETSDYRTDSHESLDSDVAVSVGSIRTQPSTAAASITIDKRSHYEQPIYENCKQAYDDSQETYANLQEIQKVIHSSRAPTSLGSPTSPNMSVHTNLQEIQKVIHSSRAPTSLVGLTSPNLSVQNCYCASPDIQPASKNHFEQQIKRLPPKLAEKQGHLNRAKTMDNGKTKKPKWSVSYMLLHEETLFLCKDLKAEPKKLMSLKNLGKPEASLNISGATISKKPTNEKNKPQVLELTLAGGNVQYYLHHSDDAVLNHWQQSLENNIAVLSSQAGVAAKPAKAPQERVEVFGTPLAALCERDGLPVPRFIQECLFAVENRGLQVDGIYRVGGNVALVQKLKAVVDQNEFYDFNSNEWDINVVTSALKLFFRELPEPLFPFDKFDQFLQAFGLPERQGKINATLKLISSLPQANVDTMKMLIRHLYEVTRHHHQNRMLAQNLAIVFGPTLMWSPDDSGNLVVSMVQQGQLIEFLINDCLSLFCGR